MAAINDLIAQIDNPELRARILAELDRMNKQKKFGLVFEEHLPESVKLYDLPIKKGELVTEKAGGKGVYKVLSISDGVAECLEASSQEPKSFSIVDLVVIAQFGTPIYPYLKPIDSICNAPDSDLWHTLIEADNYHALQLLEYLYAGKVDCIYIDPPYNTGARDWKYNNDYVDGADEYRHSKWLSFMQRRLALAKKLLNPKDSVLIVTIDEKEYLHLGCLLEQMFPEAKIQMVSSVIKAGGSKRYGEFTRSGEYLFFVMFGESMPGNVSIDMSKGYEVQEKVEKSPVTWQGLRRRGGENWPRHRRPNLFYPLFIDKSSRQFVAVGEAPALGVDRHSITPPEGTFAVWPLAPNGDEGTWQISQERFMKQYNDGTLIVNTVDEEKEFASVLYLKSGDISRINSGEVRVIGRNEKGQLIFESADESLNTIKPGTIWNMPLHDASTYGTLLMRKILPGNNFAYPKSLYAVRDCLDLFTRDKKNALIIDFFAGSGTTLHAVNLLNAEDGGRRRCIMVTNNEVSGDEAKVLLEKGILPGEPDWEKLGIARYTNWPRTVCSITGVDGNGNPLKGDYLVSSKEIPMAEGFKANAIFFKLGFLSKNSVKLGRQFRELLPVLWMKAGAVGKCPELKTDVLPDWLILPENKMAVLIDDNQYHAFKEEMEKVAGLETLYIITDFEREYTVMAEELGIPNTFQLYRDYLDNFRINHSR